MDPRRLEHFLAVAERKSFTRAAQALRIAQPSLSQSIKALEREIGLTLFHRLPGGLELTQAGERLLVPAMRVLREIRAAQSEMQEFADGTGGSLDIVAPTSLIALPTARLVAPFAREHPNVRLTIREASDSRSAVERLVDGTADVAVFVSHDVRPGIEHIDLLEYHLFAVFPPDTAPPGAHTDELEWTALADTTLIGLAPHTVSRRQIEARGLESSVRMEVHSAEAVVELVTAGVGAAVLVEPYARLAATLGATIRRLVPSVPDRVALGTREGEASPAARRLVALARAASEGHAIGLSAD